eukprot:g16687.t1
MASGAWEWPSTVLVDQQGNGLFGNGRVVDADADVAYFVYSADLDGDGDQDLLSLSFHGDFVRWYMNEDGKGTFSEAMEISADSNGAERLAIGDLDGDGFSDVVVAIRFDNQITWFRNLAGDAFSVGGSIDVTEPTDVALVDVDGDGDLDVIYTSFVDDQVGWYTNADGQGALEVGGLISTNSNGAWKMAAADLTGDRNLDVVLASLYDRVELFKNSDGVFSLGVELEEQTPASGAADIVTADFDGDGDLDVVSASFDGLVGFDSGFLLGRLILFKNDGTGSFEEGEDIGLLDSARSVVAVDLDNDEDIDLVACDTSGGRIVWYENDGGGGFSAPIDIALDVGVSYVIAADLDGDGDLDLASSNFNDRVVWYENLLDKATPAPLQVTTPSPDPTAAETLTPASSSMMSPTNPTQSPVSSIDRTAPTFAPITAPIGGGDPAADDNNNGSGNDATTDIWVGVISTLISAAIIGAAGFFCRRRRQ